MEYNPFTNRNMIRKEAEFVGRTRELNDIFPRLQTGNCVSIVGDRRIGKSSLLYHIYLTGQQRLGSNYKICYLSLHDPTMKKPHGFAKGILAAAEVPFEVVPLKNHPLIMLGRCLKQHPQQVIVLLDEFEKITQYPDLFNDDFFEGLRHFCEERYLTLVTASRKSLKTLTNNGDLSSPLWNIFANTRLGEFVYEDHLDEVSLFLTTFWDDRLQPTEEEMEFLIAHPSHHPLVMQVVSYQLLQNRLHGFADWKIQENIELELQSYFRNHEDKVKKWLKQDRPKLLDNISWTTEYIGKQFKNLSPLKGLANIKGA